MGQPCFPLRGSLSFPLPQETLSHRTPPHCPEGAVVTWEPFLLVYTSSPYGSYAGGRAQGHEGWGVKKDLPGDVRRVVRRAEEPGETLGQTTVRTPAVQT